MKALKYIIVSSLIIGSFSLVGCSSADDMANNARGAIDGYNNDYYSDYYNNGDGTTYDENGMRKYGNMYNDGWNSSGNNWGNTTGYDTMYNGSYNWSMPYSGDTMTN